MGYVVLGVLGLAVLAIFIVMAFAGFIMVGDWMAERSSEKEDQEPPPPTPKEKLRALAVAMQEAAAEFSEEHGIGGRCLTLNYGDRAIEVHAADCPASVVARMAFPTGIIAGNDTMSVALSELSQEQLRELGIESLTDPKTLN